MNTLDDSFSNDTRTTPDGECIYWTVDWLNLNRLWQESARAAGGADDDYVYAERQVATNDWESNELAFGPARLTYDLAARKVRTFRNLMWDTHVRLVKHGGVGARQIRRVDRVRGTREQSLAVSVNVEEHHLQFSAAQGGDLSLVWAGSAEYLFDDPVILPRIARYYDDRKKLKLSGLALPSAVALQELHIYLRMSLYRAMTLSAYSKPQSISPYILKPEDADRFTEDPAKIAEAVMHGRPFEIVDGQPPADQAWGLGLLAPVGCIEGRDGSYSAQKDEYSLNYHAIQNSNPASTSTSESVYAGINPLVYVLSAGRAAEALTLEPQFATGSLAFQGTAHGRLSFEQGGHYYTPPVHPTPLAQFNLQGDTLQPAALRSSLATPTVTDTVKATAQGQSALATFVAYFVPPTHFIRVARHPDGLQLKFLYFNRYHEEKEVSLANTRWHILAGNGSVSTQGVFEPVGRQPTPFTVVMAEDLANEDEWRWAVTVIPMPLWNEAAIEQLFEG